MKTENIKKVVAVSKVMERLYAVDVEVDGKVVLDDWKAYSGNVDWSNGSDEDRFAFLQCHFMHCNTEEIVKAFAKFVGDSLGSVLNVEKLTWYCPIRSPAFGLIRVFVELKRP